MTTTLLTLLAACQPELDTVVTVTPDADNVTVARATLDRAVPGQAWIEWESATEETRATPADSDANAFTLLGLRADTRYTWRLMSAEDGADVELASGQFRTDPLPTNVPLFDVEGGDVEMPYTLFSMTSGGGDDAHSTLYVLDSTGAIVWYRLVEGLVLSARVTRDGTGVAWQTSAPTSAANEDDSRIERVRFDGSGYTRVAAPMSHHDFLELPDGSFVTLSTTVRMAEEDQVPIAGDVVVRHHLDGTDEELWNAFDEVPIAWNEGWELEPRDWTHGNGLAWDEENDRFAISLFRQHQVHLFSGDGSWCDAVGGDGGYAFVGDPGFGPQHAPRFQDGKLLVFDNAGGGVSRLAAYTLDDEARTATLAWDRPSPWGDQILVLGDGLLLPDGSTLTAWGEQGRMLTLSPDGQPSRIVVAQAHGAIGRVSVFDSFYGE
jgi:hypothetical protein